MPKLVYCVAVSIDGVIAGPGGEYDFYPIPADLQEYLRVELPETMPAHVRAHTGLDGVPNRRFDTVLMGHGTYRPGLAAGMTSPYPHLRQYVFSRSLPGSPDPAVALVREDPVGLVRRLKAQPGNRDIWLCGGGVLAGQFLPEIDELLIKQYPVVAGAGLPLFAGPFAPREFTPERSRAFSNGATITTYRPATYRPAA